MARAGIEPATPRFSVSSPEVSNLQRIACKQAESAGPGKARQSPQIPSVWSRFGRRVPRRLPLRDKGHSIKAPVVEVLAHVVGPARRSKAFACERRPPGHVNTAGVAERLVETSTCVPLRLRCAVLTCGPRLLLSARSGCVEGAA